MMGKNMGGRMAEDKGSKGIKEMKKVDKGYGRNHSQFFSKAECKVSSVRHFTHVFQMRLVLFSVLHWPSFLFAEDRNRVYTRGNKNWPPCILK
jgi:hypothetical protein